MIKTLKPAFLKNNSICGPIFKINLRTAPRAMFDERIGIPYNIVRIKNLRQIYLNKKANVKTTLHYIKRIIMN